MSTLDLQELNRLLLNADGYLVRFEAAIGELSSALKALNSMPIKTHTNLCERCLQELEQEPEQEQESIGETPFMVVDDNELGSSLGETHWCSACEVNHPIKYGTETLSDGTVVESKFLAFYRCRGKSYLAGINGKEWRSNG